MVKYNMTIVDKDGNEQVANIEFESRTEANDWITNYKRKEEYSSIRVNYIESTGASALNRIFG